MRLPSSQLAVVMQPARHGQVSVIDLTLHCCAALAAHPLFARHGMLATVLNSMASAGCAAAVVPRGLERGVPRELYREICVAQPVLGHVASDPASDADMETSCSDLRQRGISQMFVVLPARDIVCRRLYGIPQAAALERVMQWVCAAQQRGIRTMVLLQSALSCRFEGAHIPAPEVADVTLALQRCTPMGDAEFVGNQGAVPLHAPPLVMWDDSGATATPRAMENLCKTAAARGCDMRAVGLVARRRPDGDPAAACAAVARALEFGVGHFGATFVDDGAHAPVAVADVLRCVLQLASESSCEEVEQLTATFLEARSAQQMFEGLLAQASVPDQGGR